MVHLTWFHIENWVVKGIEGSKIELKSEFPLNDRVNRARFAKLVTAMANAPGGTGYFVVGVVDRRDRRSNDLEDAISGAPADLDEYQRLVQQALVDFANPVPDVECVEVDVPGTSKTIAVVVVHRSRKKPHEIVADSGSVTRGTYIRRGAETFPATAADMRAMIGSTADHAVVVNFTHPVTEEQCREIGSKTGLYIADVLQPLRVPVHFQEDLPFEEQVREMVDEVGLTAEEWQELQILLNVPGYAPIAAALVAEIHGRTGHFPKVLRFRRPADDSTRYGFAEIMQLQRIRDAARGRRGRI